jgi:hypothetical protein
MPLRTFRIFGLVTDATTKKGVPDLRVETWSADAAQHAVFGSSLTDERGQFLIAANIDLPGGVVGAIPAVLKVFQNAQPVPATGQAAIPNLLAVERPVVLQVQLPAHEEALTDRVTVPQMLSAIDFVRLSDFKGVFQEGKDRVSAAAGLMVDTIRNALSQIELEPLRPSAVRNKDVVHQDPATAGQRLQAQGVAVNAVKPYRGDFESLGTVTSLPANLKPGDKVDLYEENGVVKAYGIVREPKPQVDPATVVRLDGDVKTLRADATVQSAQVAQLKAQLTQRDATIASLSADLVSVKKANSDLAAQIKPERIAALEDAVKKLQAQNPPR